MKLFKNILKGILGLLFVAALVAAIFLYQSGPELPPDVDEQIDLLLMQPTKDLIKGSTGFANSGGIKIWYESIEPNVTPKGVILLVMGISNDALGWPMQFIDYFVEAGYQVVRYDHRGTGLSDWMEDYDPDNPYTLKDMANDGVEVLNALQIEKANVIGVSMGGMIAQQMAIDNTGRIQTLCSIMSSGNILDTQLPSISSEVAIELIKVAIKYSVVGTQKNMVKLHLASRTILMGKAVQKLDVNEIGHQVLYNVRARRGYNSKVSAQHQTAVSLTGSRYDQLKNLKLPTLIIHGIDDPFIPIEHAKKCVDLIPNADSLWIKNMGHDLPIEFINQISNKILGLLSEEE